MACGFLLTSCVAESGPEPGERAPEARGDHLWIQPSAGCDEPVAGFEGWSEQALERGFDLRGQLPEFRPPNSFGGVVVAEDLDGDLDIDIAGVTPDGVVTVFANDGAGRFTRGESYFAPWEPGRRLYVGLSAVDLNDDGLPELVQAGTNAVRMVWNLGGLGFSEPEYLAVDLTDTSINHYATLSFGDAEGDGQLDLLLPGFGALGPDGPPLGAPDLYLLRDSDGEGWGEPQELDNPFVPSQSFCGVWTDQNRDGDRDILLTTVGMRPFALFRTGGRDGDRLDQRDEAANLGSTATHQRWGSRRRI
jgi:hypothetical protein